MNQYSFKQKTRISDQPNFDDYAVVKWLRKTVSNRLLPLSARNIYDVKLVNPVTLTHPNYLVFDQTLSNDNLLLENDLLIWCSYLTTNYLINKPENNKFKYSLAKNYSLISYVYKIYVTQKEDYVKVDIISDKDYLTNYELEILINEEMKLSNIFSEIPFYFNYFNSKEYETDNNSVLIYQNNASI